ncbi:MAG: hypothetical protein R3E88_18690 [Myxococcota bacterium]|nr:hypothetical protein [Myxococcales bacterium]
MKLRTLLAALALVALAGPSAAVVKVYDSTPPHGTPSDRLRFTTTLCPPIQASPGTVAGGAQITDTGGGTVTLTGLTIEPLVNTNFDTTSVFGPGSYVFVISRPTEKPAVPFVAPGSTAPGGTIDWGVLGGWSRTGFTFCASSPQTICTAGTQVPHGVTVNAPDINSPTYDLGTWAFDAEGDYSAVSGYINGTQNGGTTNGQYLLRGVFVGGGVPALPLVGAGALALGLLVGGMRTALRKR